MDACMYCDGICGQASELIDYDGDSALCPWSFRARWALGAGGAVHHVLPAGDVQISQRPTIWGLHCKRGIRLV